MFVFIHLQSNRHLYSINAGERIWSYTLNTLKKVSALVLAGLVSPSISADMNLEPITVTAKKINTKDTEATFASEVYDANDIKSSGSDSVYSFLNQNTSINVMPSYGNTASQLIDMRGYGIGNGYQNIVVTINGRRLNNIDMSSPLLGTIPLESIERIEITKGSGSVIYGDNAMAGAIHIYTKKTTSSSVSASIGNYGHKSASFRTGISESAFDLSVSGKHDELDGFNKSDVNGDKDDSSTNSYNIDLDVKPIDELTLSVNKDHANVDTRYPGSMTLEEFKEDPRQNSGNTYTHQKYSTDTLSFGLAASLSDALTIELNHSKEDKTSNYITYTNESDYEYISDEILVKYAQEKYNITTGMQHFDGDRTSSTNVTNKTNTGYFVQGELFINDITLSLGGRRESVDYSYEPLTGTNLDDSQHLSSYDIGFNQKLSDNFSWFSNYNKSFQAPDVDRFFNYGGTFNGFIKPSQAKTLNIGLNHVSENDKSKVTVFRSNLDDEIYYEANTYTNTNIDESHKYGIEFQNRHQLTSMLASTFNYSYIRAIIDQEDRGNGSYDGKNLPGVSKHNINIGLHFTPVEHSTFVLTHTYRSSTYAANDFANEFSQKQQPYQSTDLSYRFTYKHLELTAAVDNLFEESNGIWIRDDAIYPVNSTRRWRIGAQYNF